MWASMVEKPLRLLILLSGVFAMITASCMNSEAGVQAALTKASTAQQERPAKLRYYGGPKSPMYLE